MESQNNLYEHIGGKEKIGQMVDDFYKNVMNDESVNHFFKNIDMEKQREHQTNFLSYAFGGPNQYSGRTIANAHQNINTEHAHFDSIINHLQNAMKNHEIEEEHMERVIRKISEHRQDIVSE
ncbi:group 1 truncated hemoglobin [Bacillus sp. AFS055030]|uniref:group I truncated hemoglobin n=1 Tax=Bacillus sp. AFS055030 TaxID=2033507 RepID=UPI000BFD7692|nr:group 1 truncated hemoglobin [Bacillus sp. AFS055030]PGL73439.1 group 1 truncated hemoglobin [Bacillus sp. AFS055030]